MNTNQRLFHYNAIEQCLHRRCRHRWTSMQTESIKFPIQFAIAWNERNEWSKMFVCHVHKQIVFFIDEHQEVNEKEEQKKNYVRPLKFIQCSEKLFVRFLLEKRNERKGKIVPMKFSICSTFMCGRLCVLFLIIRMPNAACATIIKTTALA